MNTTPPVKGCPPAGAASVGRHHRGRPTKKNLVVIHTVLQSLSRGLPRSASARSAGISRSTLHRWMQQSRTLRGLVLEMEHLCAPQRARYRWRHHPFRGLRPPRAARLRQKPYPPPRFR